MIEVPAEVLQTVNAVSPWAEVVMPKIYGAILQMMSMFTRPPPPLTASRATLIKRLRYPGGRKFRRACKRLGLRLNMNMPAIRTGPPCEHCGRSTVPRESGGPALCSKTFSPTESSAAGGTLVWCEPPQVPQEGL